MLGAYQPAPNIIDALRWSIESLSAEYYKVFVSSFRQSRSEVSKKLVSVDREWLTRNLQNLLDLLRNDYNRKVPSKGMMPRIIGEVIEDNEKGWLGAYYVDDNSIKVNVAGYRSSFQPILNNGESILNQPEIFAAKFEAADLINTIFHEFVHATQSTRYGNTEPSKAAMSFYYSINKGATYASKIMEIASFSTDILNWAVVTPRRIYRDENLKRILGFSIAVSQELNIYPNYMWLLGCVRAGVIIEGITEEKLLLHIYKNSLVSNNQFEGKFPFIRAFILKNRGSFNVRDEFRRIREGRVSKPLFDKFKKDFEPYIQLHLRNIRRRIHNFQPINEYYGNQNNALYKPNFYALKL